MSDEFRRNLMGPEPTYLPEETDVVARLEAGDEPVDLAAKYPASPQVWAALADEAFEEGNNVESYAYARVGYHRGLDALRRSGWRGTGPIPWSHVPNRGFLRSLYALGRAAAAIGETEEVDRIRKFLDESDPQAKGAIEAL